VSAAIFLPPALADLMARAGASDTDRPAWLAERRGGITATEVRDLYIRAKSTAKLIAIKLEQEAERDLGAYIPRVRYGKDREPIIAQQLRGEGFEPESRVFQHPENSRHLASPDGVRVNFDGELEISEIKTDEHGIEPGAETWDATGYAIQALWGLYVTGARRCRFAIEECIRTADGFEPGEVRRFWIERDDELIAELVELADTFLTAMDDMRENGIDPIAVSLLEDAIAANEAQKVARDALEAYCASTGVSSLRIPEGSLSYSTPAPRKSFQQTAFKEAHPDMYAEFVEASAATKPTLRITPARKKEETEVAA
jgi:hypothetical protein